MAERHCGVSCHGSSASAAELPLHVHLQASSQSSRYSLDDTIPTSDRPSLDGVLSSNHGQLKLHASDRNVAAQPRYFQLSPTCSFELVVWLIFNNLLLF